MPYPLFLLLMVAFFAGASRLFNVVMPMLLDVRCGDAGLQFVLFRRFVIHRIPYAAVTHVERLRGLGRFFGGSGGGFPVSLGNRFFSGGVSVHTQRGMMWLLTPHHPDEFVERVRSEARAAGVLI